MRLGESWDASNLYLWLLLTANWHGPGIDLLLLLLLLLLQE